MHPARPRLAALSIALAVTGCHAEAEPDDVPPPTPGLELSGRAYDQARSGFRTRLIRGRPIGDDAGPVATPEDAIEVHYRSGETRLLAFASPASAPDQSRPGVIFLHGGFGLAASHWELTRPFRDAGYVALMPSLRGENGQAGAYSLFYDEVDDVLAATDALAARRDVDPRRIFVAGHSVGGTLAMLAALASDRYRAAASFSGSPDQVVYTRGRPERVPFDPGDRDEFRMRSPVAFADRFRCPVRLYFGEDEFWLQSPTRRTAGLACAAGLDVRAIEVPGGHESARPEVVRRCLAFFADR